MGKLVDPELANVRTGDLTVREVSYLAGLEGNHAAPDLKFPAEALQHLLPGCGGVSALACGAASSTALERNATSRNGGHGNRWVFMVERGSEEVLCHRGQETMMDLLDPSFERH
jgi:hypothetical protein